MKLPRRQFLHLAAGAVALPAVSRIAWAQTYPTRPVRFIVGAVAGSAPDILARPLSALEYAMRLEQTALNAEETVLMGSCQNHAKRPTETARTPDFAGVVQW
jgi:hypothetical protein